MNDTHSLSHTKWNCKYHIRHKMLLKVNREKTTVVYIGKAKFLGYGFYPKKTGMMFRVHTKSINKMRAKVKEITARKG